MAIQAGRVGVRADQVDAYGRVNDTSFFNKIIDKLITWVDLPVWKGGTEQLLPENDDEPETSPILCDIDYPDQERKNQYFTYRESPTGSDGIAKIESIRGNTIVWNQLVNGITTSTADGITTEYDSANHEFIITNNSRTSNYSSGSTRGAITDSLIIGHKYLILTSPIVTGVICSIGSGNDDKNNSIYTATSTTAVSLRITNAYDFVSAHPVDSVTKVKIRVHDLTTMGLDSISTVEGFTSLFPLSYYAYDTGSLLNFTADKIKTVGFNQFDGVFESGYINVLDGTLVNGNYIRTANYIPCIPNTNYYGCALENPSSFAMVFYDADYNYVGYLGTSSIKNSVYTTPNNAYYCKFYTVTTVTKICINISDTSKNGTYESYTSNILELPISTFFPTGMKEAGTAYDRLLPRRAEINIGEVDLGSLTYSYGNNSGGWENYFFYVSLSDSKANLTSAMYDIVYDETLTTVANMTINYNSTNHYLYIRNDTYNDPALFKTAMSGVMLNYELAEPIVLPTIDFE